MEGSCEYIEYAVADRRHGVVIQPGGWGGGLTTPHRKKRNMLRNVTKGLGIIRILWNDLRHGKWI
jgi:hypothetical protein